MPPLQHFDLFGSNPYTAQSIANPGQNSVGHAPGSIILDSQALRESLHRLAANHRWTYASSCRRLLESLPGFAAGLHPVQVVAALNGDQLEELLEDDQFVDRAHDEIQGLDAVLSDAVDPEIAYCSPEFALSDAVPQYAGGLGVLAGDHLKTSSDLGVPLAGVGLFYRYGVFRQRIEDDAQTEFYDAARPDEYGAADTGLTVEVPFPGRSVHAKIWRLDIGRVPLILLDTNHDGNSEHDRNISDRLYIGNTDHRIAQEMILGVGGARALAALGWPIRVHHLNEGHAGFITLELIDRAMSNGDLSRALAEVRRGLVFTTHTPVPAGIDKFDRSKVTPYLKLWADRWDVPLGDVFDLGKDPKEPGKFNMPALCLRTAAEANGVSELHGRVSRGLFADIGIGDRIGFVTNGVHARTWTAPHVQDLFDDVLGESWSEGDPEAWRRVGNITSERLEAGRRLSSQTLARLVSKTTEQSLDPDALIIGFARRFAPYKRATLFMRDRDRLARLLFDDERPVHFVFAGKAHPSDELGKSLVSDIVSFSRSAEANGRLTFIPDYSMGIAHAMVQGCDIWLNNPIRPREASGTSGQKAALNGGLNCSVLDGWWAEMFDGQNGWKIAASDAEDTAIRDDEEAGAVLDTLEAIATEYHSARYVFNGRIRHGWLTLGPLVTSARMLRDYEDRVYEGALERTKAEP